jgi:hypothetical protein
MSEVNWAPGAFDDVVNAIPDLATQSCLRVLYSQQVSSNQHQQQTLLLLQGLCVDIGIVKDALLSRVQPAPSVVYPSEINAAGDASSRSSPVTSSCGRSSSVIDGTGALQCPFCPHSHFTEKSHVQHMTRIAARSGLAYSGSCVVADDNPYLQSFPGSYDDKLRTFTQQYVACLASSNKKDVNAVRAAALQKFLVSCLAPSSP